jgi:hypothetical protein
MLEWLAAICVFWTVTSIYLGGTSVDLEGGSGLRQVIGLIDMLILYLVVWGALHTVLGGFAGLLGSLILPTTIAVLALPLLARIGFRIMGVKVVHVEGH